MAIQITCTDCMIRQNVKDIVRHARCKAMVCRTCIGTKQHVCHPMRIARLDDFANEQSNITWLIDALLPSVGWTLLVGTRGYGKTTLALQLCAALQEGKPFFNRPTIQTNVFYIQADSLPDEWQAIVQRVAPHSLGWTCLDVPTACMDNPGYVSSLTTLTTKVKPGFIVFDSLYNLTNPKHLNTGNILDAVNAMKSIAGNIPWMLVHHPPHGETRASGHNSLSGNCSNEWALLKTQLKVVKGRLVKDKEIYIERDEDGLWVLADDSSDTTDSDDGLGIFRR
jgi:RecA-family ATPase